MVGARHSYRTVTAGAGVGPEDPGSTPKAWPLTEFQPIRNIQPLFGHHFRPKAATNRTYAWLSTQSGRSLQPRQNAARPITSISDPDSRCEVGLLTGDRRDGHPHLPTTDGAAARSGEGAAR